MPDWAVFVLIVVTYFTGVTVVWYSFAWRDARRREQSELHSHNFNLTEDGVLFTFGWPVILAIMAVILPCARLRKAVKNNKDHKFIRGIRQLPHQVANLGPKLPAKKEQIRRAKEERNTELSAM